MELPSTKLEDGAPEPNETAKKAPLRFNPHPYFEEYVPPWSNTFQHRTKLLWELIEADKRAKNEPSWAQCCFVVERKKLKGHLGHPKSAIIPISRLFSKEGIQNEVQLSDFFTRTLPINLNRDQRLPQVNMKHPGATTEHIDLTEPVQTACQCRAEQTTSDILGLQVQLEDATKQNKDLCKRIASLEEKLQVP